MTAHIDRRKFLISKIRATLLKAQEQGIELDIDKFVTILGAEEGIARRTALDYISCARMQLDTVKSDIQKEWEKL